jgi:hypothetical protein
MSALDCSAIEEEEEEEVIHVQYTYSLSPMVLKIIEYKGA